MTVADYANSDPAVVKSGRVKKAVANAVQQEGESAGGILPLCMMWETLPVWPEKMCLIWCLEMSPCPLENQVFFRILGDFAASLLEVQEELLSLC